jgi:hypothetical protein
VARGDEPLNDKTQSRKPPKPAARKRISLIGVYSGRFPAIWPLYFKSAAFNRQIQFLIFTDQEPPSPLPANIRFTKMDQEAFERLASGKLGHKMRLAFPRKLVDYKPAYGLIFSEYVRHSHSKGRGLELLSMGDDESNPIGEFHVSSFTKEKSKFHDRLQKRLSPAR